MNDRLIRHASAARELGQRWLFHAGVIGILVWAPLVLAIRQNRHSLQLEAQAHLLIAFVFLLAPVGLLAAADALAPRHPNRSWFRSVQGAVLVLLLAASACAHFPAEATTWFPVAAGLFTVVWVAGAVRRANIRQEWSSRAHFFLLWGALAAVLGAAYWVMPRWVAQVAAGALVLDAFRRAPLATWTFFEDLMAMAGLLSAALLAYFLYLPLGFSVHFGATPGRDSGAGLQAGENVTRGPVLVLVFDGLSRDALLDPSGEVWPRYPNFRQMAQSGILVRNAATDYDHTLSSIPSLLSGRLGFHRSLAETTVLDQLDPPWQADLRGVALAYCDSFPRGVVSDCFDSRPFYALRNRERLLGLVGEIYLEAAFPSAFGFSQDHRDGKEVTLFQIGLLLEELRRERLENRFYFVHVFSPHPPFVLENDGRMHGRDERVAWFHAAQTPADLEQAFENYRREIEFGDRLVGQVVDILKSRGVWSSATVVITADHGYCWDWECRTLGGGRALREFVNWQVAGVPLIIKPDAAFSRPVAARSYQHVDLAPTLLDLLGIPARAGTEFDGHSIFRAGPPRARLRVRTMSDRVWSVAPDGQQWSREPDIPVGSGPVTARPDP